MFVLVFFFFIIELIFLILDFQGRHLFFSRDSPNISTVIPAIDHINDYLARACGNIEFSKAFHATLDIGKQTLNCYYNKTDHSEVYRIAMGRSSPSFQHSSYLFPSNFQSSTLIINYNTLKKSDGRKPGSTHLTTSSAPNLTKLMLLWMSRLKLQPLNTLRLLRLHLPYVFFNLHLLDADLFFFQRSSSAKNIFNDLPALSAL